MSKILIPLHIAKLSAAPTGVATGFKKFYLKGEWFKLYDGVEIDLVLDRPLDNYTPQTGIITSDDTVLTSIEKLSYQINNINSVTNTSNLINDGEDGVNPYITALDIPTSLIENITVDSYLGLRLKPLNSLNNGFYINKSVNASVGYYAKNTDDSGNGAVSAFYVGGIGTIYQNYASFFHANNGYFVPYLRNKSGINSNNDFFFIGWQGSSFDFRTGTGTFGTETSKFYISNLGVISIGVPPVLDNSVDSIIGRKNDGTLITISKNSIKSVKLIRNHDFISGTDYNGYAAEGSLTSDSAWFITKIVILSNGSTIVTTATNVKWDDRYTETYI